MKDIENHVVINWAPQWQQLAIELNFDQCLINIIQCDHGKDCIECCSKMLNMWLEQNTSDSATWETLIKATDNVPIDLSGMCMSYTKDYLILIFCEISIKALIIQPSTKNNKNCG